MNVAILIGRLTKDPELRYIPSTGKAVATFSMAVDRGFTGKDGQKQTDFFNIVVWGKIAENCANYLAKGRLAAIKGQIQNRSYEDNNGVKKYITEIIADEVQFLDKLEAKPEGAAFTPKSLDDAGYKELKDDDVPF